MSVTEATGSIIVGMFVCCLFCLPKTIWEGVFVPARTDSVLKLLSTLGPGKYHFGDHIQITGVVHLFPGAVFFFFFLHLYIFSQFYGSSSTLTVIPSMSPTQHIAKVYSVNMFFNSLLEFLFLLMGSQLLWAFSHHLNVHFTCVYGAVESM